MDNIDITYSVVVGAGTAPNQCKGQTTYQGGPVVAIAASWAEAKNAVISHCKQIKALLPVPPDDTVDLDT
jgi:hypothetical protein